MPRAEVVRCLEAETDGFEIVSSGPGYVVAAFDERFLDPIADRIALTHSIGRYIGEYDPDDVSNIESTVLPEGTFAVRGKRFEGMMRDVDSQGIIRKVGGILSRHNDVNLKHPDTVVRMQMCDKVHLYIEQRVTETDLLEKRKVGERPFFSPISLHPKYARALINLTGVKRGGTVLDPFCGTGGIVIEAAEMGMKAVASDFDEEMVIGCQENMEFYGLDLHDFEVLDIGSIGDRFSGIDAVCTDPPYGRSTKTGGENIDDIYRRAGEAIPRVLSEGGRAGVVLPHEVSFESMTLEAMYLQRVHGSLSRHYHIFRPR
ncbi:MAG: methyltransferase domain-containing protein [Candidatus Methanomethylophilaceae archaeon]|nr:methyltransferase domain-containing protein [Candidatus Methanomethylophilaceae archaeon]